MSITPKIAYKSGNFHGDQIFALIRNHFTSQNIRYAKFISVIVCYKKLFKSQKLIYANKKKIHISPIFSNFVTLGKKEQNTGYTVYSLSYPV